jgi:hypothetical protein
LPDNTPIEVTRKYIDDRMTEALDEIRPELCRSWNRRTLIQNVTRVTGGYGAGRTRQTAGLISMEVLSPDLRSGKPGPKKTVDIAETLDRRGE